MCVEFVVVEWFYEVVVGVEVEVVYVVVDC